MQTDRFPSFIRKILENRRKNRVDFILSKINVKKNLKIIDIGCGVDSRSFDRYISKDWSIQGVDILPDKQIKHIHPNFSYLRQDAQDLSRFKDNEFDLAVSIGMLEHITDKKTFNQIISELRRVAQQYVIIVPAKYSWLEPHFGIPFFPIFPNRFKILLTKTFNLCGQRENIKQDPELINKKFKWLSNSQYRKIFTDSIIKFTPTFEMIAIIKKA